MNLIDYFIYSLTIMPEVVFHYAEETQKETFLGSVEGSEMPIKAEIEGIASYNQVKKVLNDLGGNSGVFHSFGGSFDKDNLSAYLCTELIDFKNNELLNSRKVVLETVDGKTIKNENNGYVTYAINKSNSDNVAKTGSSVKAVKPSVYVYLPKDMVESKERSAFLLILLHDCMEQR